MEVYTLLYIMLVYVHTYVHTSHLNAHTTITNPSTILYIQYYAIYMPDARQPTAYRIRNWRPDLPYPSMTSPVASPSIYMHSTSMLSISIYTIHNKYNKVEIKSQE